MFTRIVASVVLVTASVCLAQSYAQETANFAPPTPGVEHQKLAQDVGVWDAKVQVWLDPDAEPEVNKAVEKNQMMGDFWLVSEFKGSMMGAPYSGRSQTGYDPIKKMYVGTWIDSMSPHVMTTEGNIDENGDLVLTGSGIDCITKQPMTCKMIGRTNADGTRTFEMHAPGPDGNMMKIMQIDYTKRNAS